MVSYGVLLPTRGIVLSGNDNLELAAKTQADIIDMAKRAEASGFGSVWVGDSVLARPRLEPLSTLAAIAGATDAVELGTAVYLPPLRNPMNIAHLTATVDQVSGGRLVLGIGVGSAREDVKDEFENIGVAFDERGARLNEQLALITELWSGDSIDFDGDWYQITDGGIGFPPVRRPPIYLPFSGFDSPEDIPSGIRTRFIEHSDGWLPIAISPTEYGEKLPVLESLLEDAGRSVESFERGFYLDIVIGSDTVSAREQAREFYNQYYYSIAPFSDEQIDQRGVFGPPSVVADAIDAYHDAGVEMLVVRFTAMDQRSQLRRFARLVGLS